MVFCFYIRAKDIALSTMNLNLHTLSHAPLLWKNKLPVHFKGLRLPGGSLASAEGTFGSVCLQEVREKNFCIRYRVFDILEPFTVKEKLQGDGLHTCLV